MKKVNAIKSEIAKLQAQLKDAERQEIEGNLRAIERAAKRSGLAREGLSAKELEKYFRAVIKKARETAQEPAGAAQTSTQAASMESNQSGAHEPAEARSYDSEPQS